MPGRSAQPARRRRRLLLDVGSVAGARWPPVPARDRRQPQLGPAAVAGVRRARGADSCVHGRRVRSARGALHAAGVVAGAVVSWSGGRRAGGRLVAAWVSWRSPRSRRSRSSRSAGCATGDERPRPWPRPPRRAVARCTSAPIARGGAAAPPRRCWPSAHASPCVDILASRRRAAGRSTGSLAVATARSRSLVLRRAATRPGRSGAARSSWPPRSTPSSSPIPFVLGTRARGARDPYLAAVLASRRRSSSPPGRRSRRAGSGAVDRRRCRSAGAALPLPAAPAPRARAARRAATSGGSRWSRARRWRSSPSRSRCSSTPVDHDRLGARGRGARVAVPAHPAPRAALRLGGPARRGLRAPGAEPRDPVLRAARLAAASSTGTSTPTSCCAAAMFRRAAWLPARPTTACSPACRARRAAFAGAGRSAVPAAQHRDRRLLLDGPDHRVPLRRRLVAGPHLHDRLARLRDGLLAAGI